VDNTVRILSFNSMYSFWLTLLSTYFRTRHRYSLLCALPPRTPENFKNRWRIFVSGESDESGIQSQVCGCA
jgi:hypothetical protein